MFFGGTKAVFVMLAKTKPKPLNTENVLLNGLL